MILGGPKNGNEPIPFAILIIMMKFTRFLRFSLKLFPKKQKKKKKVGYLELPEATEQEAAQ